MSFSEIILMNVGIAAILVAILALVMLVPARLDAQHRGVRGERRKKTEGRRAAIHAQHVPTPERLGRRPIHDQY